MAIREHEEDFELFESAAAFGRWLARHHATKTALWVGFHKKATGKPTLTWPESVDEALCYGWIDGIRKGIDARSYKIRFTPRQPTSIWSAINVGRVAELTKLGRMRPAGLAAFERRRADKTGIYTHEQTDAQILDPAYEKKLRADARAWSFFKSCSPSYRKAATRWVMTAKQEATRQSRLATLVSDSAAGRTVPPLTYKPKA